MIMTDNVNVMLSNTELDLIYDALMEMRYSTDNDSDLDIIDTIIGKIVVASKD